MSETQTPRTDRAIAKWRECGLKSWHIMPEIEAFARRLERELAAERATWCDKPEDRLYHAEDQTWWRRDKDGRCVRAESPAEPDLLDTIDWTRRRSGDYRALNPDNQPLFDRFYAAPAATAESGDAWRELWNIANAERFNRERFRDDTEFADWAQSRCRHAARSPDGEK